MQVLVVVFVIAGIVIAITRLVAPSTGFVSAAVNPTAPAEASTASINVVGPFSSQRGVTLTGMPSSIEVTFQSGFTSTATTAVTALCTATEAASSRCPPDSNAGHGELDVTAGGRLRKVQLLVWIGPPLQRHDIASLVMTGSALGKRVTETARVLTGPGGGGLELLTTPLTFPAAAQFDTLSLTAGMQRTARSISSVITNPPACQGQWTGQGTVTFPNGTFSQALTIPCG